MRDLKGGDEDRKGMTTGERPDTFVTATTTGTTWRV